MGPQTSFCNVLSAYYSADSRKNHLPGRGRQQRIGDPTRQGRNCAQLPARESVDDLTAFDNVALAIFSREGKTRNIAALARRDSE